MHIEQPENWLGRRLGDLSQFELLDDGRNVYQVAGKSKVANVGAQSFPLKQFY